MKNVVLLRVLRLLRLIRALRFVPVLRSAWRMIYGLITATDTILSTMALLLLTLYLFACFGLELITNDAILKDDEVVQQNFPNLLTTMLTLIQFVTQDSIASIYVPLIKKKPPLAIYFVIIILIVSVALMNLVTAVLVERAQENSASDKEEREAQLRDRIHSAVPKLRSLFQQLDLDESGAVTIDELMIPHEQLEEILGTDVMKHGHNETMKELFEVLDVDASGMVYENEFVDGLMALALADFKSVPSAESVLLLRLMRSTRRSNDQISSTIESLSNRIPAFDRSPVLYV